ncbi:hypothetical protein V2A60_000640 [Cordyceps javanica]
MTFGPYGEDIPCSKFHPTSFAELNTAQKSQYSAWETWCSKGCVVVRCDERGFRQSPGYLDSMSADTTDSFCQAIEWAAAQPWSAGKFGLLGLPIGAALVCIYAETVHDYMYAASKFKYLRFIVSRHDLPFYYSKEVGLRLSFLDAWLKNDHREGWTQEGKVKGGLRCCLRETNPGNARHCHYLPYHEYVSTGEKYMTADKIYEVDVEIRPTSLVISPGHRLRFEVSSRDTCGSGLFLHQDPIDRDRKRFAGFNHIHSGDGRHNYTQLPIIPI